VSALAGLLIGNAAQAQVVNGGFETASGAYTSGALGWADNSGAAAGTTASAQRNTTDPFAGVAELTLQYVNSATPGGGPAAIAQSDIFPATAGAETFSFEAKGVTIGQENNQVQVQWFGTGNTFLGASGFQSFQAGLNGSSYVLKTFNLTAPAGTTGAFVQYLCAGSAVANDTSVTRIDNVTLVPEPTTMTLVGLGLFGAIAGLRKRKS